MKGVFIFIGGAVTGALASFFATKYVYDKKYSELFSEEIRKFKETYTPSSPVEVKEDTAKFPKVDISERMESEQAAASTAIDYSSIVKKYGNDEVNVVVDTTPHITDEDRFTYINSSLFASLDGYEKIDLVLYSDGKLASEHNDELVDPAFTCGEEAVEILARGDANEIYVRNELTSIEYAVSVSDSTYMDATGIFLNEDD